MYQPQLVHDLFHQQYQILQNLGFSPTYFAGHPFPLIDIRNLCLSSSSCGELGSVPKGLGFVSPRLVSPATWKNGVQQRKNPRNVASSTILRIHIAQQKIWHHLPLPKGQKQQNNTTPCFFFTLRDNKRIQATQSELQKYKTYNCTVAEISGLRSRNYLQES